MKRWLRQVAPPWQSFAFVGAAYLVPYALLAGIWWLVGAGDTELRLGLGPGQMLFDAFSKGFKEFEEVITFAAAGAYGAWRAVAFSPWFRPAYRTWLRSTPWRPGKPLPLGPSHWVLQDAVVFAPLLVVGQAHAGVHALHIVSVFAAVYLACTAYSLWHLGRPLTCYLLMMGLGAMALLTLRPVMLATLALALYALAAAVWRQALRLFPWDDLEPWRFPKLVDKRVEAPLAWPYTALSPEPRGPRLAMIDAVGLSLWVGWWLFVFVRLQGESRNPDYDQELAAWLLPMGAFIAAIMRCAIYMNGKFPPISLVARLATGRLVIPGYDRIFVAPLAAMAAGWLIPKWASAWDLSLPVLTGLTAFTVGLIALCAGPSLAHWQLTGHYRAAPVTRSNLAK